jgi:threonine/homoserine/homoserine lactone efflux protein
MIDVNLYFAFVVAVVLLMLLPGPMVSLIVGNSIAYGSRLGMITVAGSGSAMVIQLTLTGFGMAGLLGTLGGWFEWLRWIGAAYLVYLGIVQWRAPPSDFSADRQVLKSARAIYLRGFIVSLTNPKTLFFYGAFFPQFVTLSRPLVPQILLLSVTFVGLALVIDTGWALAAGRVRVLLAARGRLRNRISGGFLIGAGAVLALARGK